MDNSTPFLRYAVAGKFTRDYLILPKNDTYLDKKGGSALYSASGLKLWDNSIGLIGIVSEEYPLEWIQEAESRGFDIRGIQVLSTYFDQRNFLAYPKIDEPETNNPVAQFARIGKPFPKTLLGYTENFIQNPINNQNSPIIKIKDIPFDYLDVTAVHICSLDYPTQTRLPSFFRQGHATTITLLASNDYMNPIFKDLVPTILKDITAFICTENQIRNLFYGVTSDITEMISELDVYGCEMLVIATKKNSYLLWERSTKKRFDIPLYPSSIIDPTGILDSFCGGFLAGLRKNQDPLDAALQGSISASFSAEGVGPFYCLDALPSLVQARLDYLVPYIAKI